MVKECQQLDWGRRAIFRRAVGTIVVLTSISFSVTALAQSPCPNGGTTITYQEICLIPQIFSPKGLSSPPLVKTTLPGHSANDFQNASLSSFAPLNAAIGSQLASLPFASPASGFVYTFSASAGVPVATQQSFGPILAERAETIGRHKLFIGASYEYFAFGSVDGLGLRDIPAVFTSSLPNAGSVIQTNTRIDLHINQVTGVATFGLTNRIDVAVALPLSTVNMAVTTNATILPSTLPANRNNPAGYNYLFAGNCSSLIAQCVILSETFRNTRNVTGIGDVTFRVKGTVWKGERLAVAAAADFRAPTGNADDFLGSGTFGFTPFAVVSYAGRFSPHLNLGFQVNGNSILAGYIDTTNGTAVEGHLPNNFFYTVGADWGALKHLTLDLDFLGQEIINGPQLALTQYSNPNNAGEPQTLPNIYQYKGTFAVNNLAAGLKWNIAKELVFTGSLIYQVNNSGLRARVVPLAGLSYTF